MSDPTKAPPRFRNAPFSWLTTDPCFSHFVLRTSALYGKNPCRTKGRRNFVNLMLRLVKECDEVRVVNDQVVEPTSTVELAKQMMSRNRSDNFGLYYATAQGSCSR